MYSNDYISFQLIIFFIHLVIYMKKICAVFISTIFLLTIVVNSGMSQAVSVENQSTISSQKSYDESHVIDGVPIVGQDSRFYCTIASHTMILNYYGFNFTKYDVLYLMGGGYSLFYRSSRYLIPFSSVGCAFRPSSYNFVASVLGLEFQTFHVKWANPKSIIKERLLSCIKENISKDQPVLINLDDTILFSDHIGIKLPAIVWRFVPIEADHAIVVVGYNESNQSICYNDPMYSILGDEQKGAYIWVDEDIFMEAFYKFTLFKPYFSSTYRVKSYEKPEIPVYDEALVISQTYQRNLKRLEGNPDYYITDLDYPDRNIDMDNFSYGINASIEIQKIFENNTKRQLYAILKYKFSGNFGLKNSFFNFLEIESQELFDKDISFIFDLAVPGYKNIYRTIADEKEIISMVMHNYSSLDQKYQTCSDLLHDEADLWYEMADYNRILLNKGFFITVPNALSLFEKMYSIMDEIIEIEQALLNIN